MAWPPDGSAWLPLFLPLLLGPVKLYVCHRQLAHGGAERKYLATEFVRTGWDVKAIQKLIVTSATYRQSSEIQPELLRRDPENRLLARSPRYRLPAEMVRDEILAMSGLLSDKVGGPSVKPYQPAGVWD